MDAEKFEESVRKLANQRVNKKIMIFEKIIIKAFDDLTGTSFLDDENSNYPKPDRLANTAILNLLIEKQTFQPKEPWPAFLWEKEEKAVREELFRMMDIVQKALLAPEPKPDDCKPAISSPTKET